MEVLPRCGLLSRPLFHRLALLYFSGMPKKWKVSTETLTFWKSKLTKLKMYVVLYFAFKVSVLGRLPG